MLVAACREYRSRDSSRYMDGLMSNKIYALWGEKFLCYVGGQYIRRARRPTVQLLIIYTPSSVVVGDGG